jgi:predicted alpha/beta-hydrolase family hydrolase
MSAAGKTRAVGTTATMAETPAFLWNGPPSAPVLALAHGAGAPMDSPFMQAFAEGLGARGVRVARFEFPYMAKRRNDGTKRPPDPMAVLMATWRAVLAELGDAIAIGGKSMGGRVASMIAAEREAEGRPVGKVVCLGYPFHAAGRTEPRTGHLQGHCTPTLICQGTRDAMGNEAEVAGYALAPAVRIHWLADGDHSFKPRKASGRSEAENWAEAMDSVAGFVGVR